MRHDTTVFLKVRDDGATQDALAATPKSNLRKKESSKQSRIPADDFKAILHINAAFYSAISSLDLASMEQIWLKDNRCICHFPGSKKLVSYVKIMRSWKHAVDQMEGASRRNWIDPADVQVEFHTTEKATLFCQERIFSITCSIVDGELRPESQLIAKATATNAFKKEGGRWFMWYHQASLISNETIPKLENPNTRAVSSIAQSGESSWQPTDTTSLTMGTFDVETVVSDTTNITNTTEPAIVGTSCPRFMGNTHN